MAGYLEFRLEIAPDGDRYKARLRDTERGDATLEFIFEKPAAEIENLLLKMGRTRSGTRSAPDSEQRRAATAMGAYLFDTVFSGTVQEKLNRARRDAEAENTALRVRLVLANDPTLLDLPWEYLYDTNRGQFLSLSKWTPVVRYVEASEPPSPLPFTPPLRILVAISGAVPPGGAELNVEHEWELLRDKALGPAIRSGLIALDRVPGSMEEIRRGIDEVDYQVFHYIGHSGFDRGESVLWLEGQSGEAQTWSGNGLGQVLGPERSLRLAVFNSCEGARSSAQDPFAGVAQSLVTKGIPAVVAMQFEITDSAAILFARNFYEALAAGDPIDRAVALARSAIYASNNDVEWGTPVLFLRSTDGVIFDHEAVGDTTAESLGRQAHWYEKARIHIEEGDWAAAKRTLDLVASEGPEYLRTNHLLKEVRQHLDDPGDRPEAEGNQDAVPMGFGSESQDEDRGRESAEEEVHRAVPTRPEAPGDKRSRLWPILVAIGGVAAAVLIAIGLLNGPTPSTETTIALETTASTVTTTDAATTQTSSPLPALAGDRVDAEELPSEYGAPIIAVNFATEPMPGCGSSCSLGGGFIYQPPPEPVVFGGTTACPTTGYASPVEGLSLSPTVDGTDHDEVFWTHRWGNVEYQIPIEPGPYIVVLRFAEIDAGEQTPETRRFTVDVEGQRSDTINIRETVGLQTALDLAWQVGVGTDGLLTIRLNPGSHDCPALNALVVFPLVED